MRKRTGLIRLVVLISILIFGIASAQAGLSIGEVVSYYSPRFGEVNDKLEWVSALSEMDLKLKGGLACGLTLSYDTSPNFRIRGEHNTFTSKTSDSSSYDLWEDDYSFKLTTTPIILSGIYRFSPDSLLCPYAGAGIGYFFTKISDEWKGYYEGEMWNTESYSDKDNPIGYQILGGIEFRGENFSLAMEARYIIAKANLNDPSAGFNTKVDLGGLFAGLIASTKF